MIGNSLTTLFHDVISIISEFDDIISIISEKCIDRIVTKYRHSKICSLKGMLKLA